MIDGFSFKDVYGIGDLLQIMQCLRSEGGCPWDREQTHESIKKNLIEETYEVIEAINQQDKALLCEELGDVLNKLFAHAVRHVFKGEGTKKRSKGQTSQTETMLSVPRELPALMRATKVQKKAAKVGFDWPDISGAVDKLYEETSELSGAIESGSEEEIAEELGDLLFSAVNVSRFVGCDAEEALTAATDKFMRRFACVEEKARERGLKLEELSLSELDALWDEAKLDLLSK